LRVGPDRGYAAASPRHRATAPPRRDPGHTWPDAHPENVRLGRRPNRVVAPPRRAGSWPHMAKCPPRERWARSEPAGSGDGHGLMRHVASNLTGSRRAPCHTSLPGAFGRKPRGARPDRRRGLFGAIAVSWAWAWHLVDAPLRIKAAVERCGVARKPARLVPKSPPVNNLAVLRTATGQAGARITPGDPPVPLGRDAGTSSGLHWTHPCAQNAPTPWTLCTISGEAP
jgi:hypothetical protein